MAVGTVFGADLGVALTQSPVMSPVVSTDIGGTADMVLKQGADSWARELLVDSDGLGRYLLIFLLAAIPLLEILVVIPIGVGLGSQPVLVAIAAFLGNVLPIYGIILGHEQLAAYLDRRRDTPDSEPSGRRKRARQLWERYGLPGLAVASPIVTGVHLAALLALGLGSNRRATAVWMTGSIAVWTVVITAASVGALSAVSALL